MTAALALIFVVLVAAVGVAVAARRNRQPRFRPAVGGGERRDFFGDRLMGPEQAPELQTTHAG